MKFTCLAVILALTVGWQVSAPGTDAAHQPLDVDCDLLSATLGAVNDFLDGEGVQFKNLGDLYSSALQDEALFDQLAALVLFFSGGEIDFESASQAIATIGSCGLTPQVIAHIRD